MRLDMQEISGQEAAVDAIEKALIYTEPGVMLAGSLGTPKCKIAQRIPTVLPELVESELRWLLDVHQGVVEARPVRMVDPSFTVEELQTAFLKSCHGVLILDSVTDFRDGALMAIAEALAEESSFRRPFLAAATTLCPCGWAETSNPCKCDNREVVRFGIRIAECMARLSLKTFAPLVWRARSFPVPGGESSHSIRQRIHRVRGGLFTAE